MLSRFLLPAISNKCRLPGIPQYVLIEVSRELRAEKLAFGN